mmetsp:Transcript_22055/g.43827  ORF Transcript_22055/g.43827 Transcript_22055/m.43827 type:complete len:692 (-) Transcript_22055:212-2287(-)
MHRFSVKWQKEEKSLEFSLDTTFAELKAQLQTAFNLGSCKIAGIKVPKGKSEETCKLSDIKLKSPHKVMLVGAKAEQINAIANKEPDIIRKAEMLVEEEDNYALIMENIEARLKSHYQPRENIRPSNQDKANAMAYSGDQNGLRTLASHYSQTLNFNMVAKHAIAGNHEHVLQFLLSKNLVNPMDADSDLATMCAAQGRMSMLVDLLRRLLWSSASQEDLANPTRPSHLPEDKVADTLDPLLIASVKNGHLRITRWLLKAGARFFRDNAQPFSNELLVCIRKEFFKHAALILENGCKVTLSELHACISKTDNVKLFKELMAEYNSFVKEQEADRIRKAAEEGEELPDQAALAERRVSDLKSLLEDVVRARSVNIWNFLVSFECPAAKDLQNIDQGSWQQMLFRAAQSHYQDSEGATLEMTKQVFWFCERTMLASAEQEVKAAQEPSTTTAGEPSFGFSGLDSDDEEDTERATSARDKVQNEISSMVCRAISISVASDKITTEFLLSKLPSFSLSSPSLSPDKQSVMFGQDPHGSSTSSSLMTMDRVWKGLSSNGKKILLQSVVLREQKEGISDQAARSLSTFLSTDFNFPVDATRIVLAYLLGSEGRRIAQVKRDRINFFKRARELDPSLSVWKKLEGYMLDDGDVVLTSPVRELLASESPAVTPVGSASSIPQQFDTQSPADEPPSKKLK